MQQEKLLQALTRAVQDIADVDAWTTVFNPGVSTLSRLAELTRDVDVAAFVFAPDDWTAKGASPEAASGQASPRVQGRPGRLARGLALAAKPASVAAS